MNILIVLISIASYSSALTLAARSTAAIDLRYGSGISPRPTSGPLQVKVGLKRAGAELFRRASSNTAYQTCGWVDRDPDQAITCGAGFACAFYFSGYSGLDQGVLQCCATSGTSIEYERCDPGTACVNYLTRYNTEATPIIESGTWYCGSVGQTCASYIFEGGRSYWSSSLAAEIYTGIFCADEATVQTVYQGYRGQLSTSPSSSSSSAPATSSSTTSQVNRPTPTTSQPAASSSTTGSSGSSSSSNTGAIAGATVGGVVGLAAIGATVGYLVWRKKRQTIPPSREISTREIDPPYGGYYQSAGPQPGSGPGYSPQYMYGSPGGSVR